MSVDNGKVQPEPIRATKLIAVEGTDEVNLLSKLKESLATSDIEIRALTGKSSLPTKFAALVNTPGFPNVTSLGIIRDADDDAEAAFKSVCGALEEVGQAVPQKPLQVVVGTQGNPKVVVLILPYGLNKGMLEDVCLQSVADDPAMPCVEDYFQCLKEKHTLPSNLSKAKVHAFLASREPPDLRLGHAAQRGFWPLRHSAFEPLKQFLSML